MKKAWEPYIPGVIYSEEEIEQIAAMRGLPARKLPVETPETDFEGEQTHGR